jgi:hypothetical protein
MALYDIKFTGKLEFNDSNKDSNDIKVGAYNINEVFSKLVPEIMDAISKQTKPRQEDK